MQRHTITKTAFILGSTPPSRTRSLQNRFCQAVRLTLAIVFMSAFSTQAALIVTTDTETSLELSWVNFSSEPFESAYWYVQVTITPPPPDTADFPTGFSVMVTHLGTPDGEDDHGTTLTVGGYYGGFVPFPDIRFPPVGRDRYIFDEASAHHDRPGAAPHFDNATLSGTQILSGGIPRDSFVLTVEHAVVPEPASIALMTVGLIGIGTRRRR